MSKADFDFDPSLPRPLNVTASAAAEVMRTFATGATRDSNKDKIDPEGFISPAVEKRFCEYMHKHRFQKDGSVRDSDNWQKGIPKDAYKESFVRHMLDVRLRLRGETPLYPDDSLEDALCALRFNIDGYLFELLREKKQDAKNFVELLSMELHDAHK